MGNIKVSNSAVYKHFKEKVHQEIILHECDPEFQVWCTLYLWTSASSLWQWGPSTILYYSCPYILVVGRKVELSAELRRWWGREPNLSSPLGSACNWVIAVQVSYWSSLEFVSQTKLRDVVSFLLLWSPFSWKNQGERAPFSSAYLHPPSMTKQVLPLGSCQDSGVGLEPLASQTKVVMLLAEWHRPTSRVSD